MAETTTEVHKKKFFTRPRLITMVVLLGLLLRMWAAWQLPVDFDEPIYLEAGFKYAQLIQAGDVQGIIDYSENSEHPPLVKLLYGLAILALGRGVSWDQALFLSRMVSVVFGTLAVLVVALIDPFAGGLLAVQTLVVKYTSQAYLEAVPLFFSLLALFLLLRSKSRWSIWFVISALALGVAGAGKYTYFPIVFVILFILIWEKRLRIGDIILYLFLAGCAFIVFNPYLWHDPVNRLMASLSYHAQYAQGVHVQALDYPWYQPILWVSRSYGFVNHPDIFFYMGFDGLIFLAALPGFWLNWKDKRWVPVWAITSMLVLLAWPTKWPQYTLVVLPAFCLAAPTAVRIGYQKLKEQELYWDWFKNMFPRPKRSYIFVGVGLAGLLTVGTMVSLAMLALNRIGWSEMAAGTSGLPNNAVNDIQALTDGRMLIGTDGGVAFWKAARGGEVMDEWTVYNPENSPLPNQRVLAVLQDNRGVFWFGTAAGLASFNGQDWAVFHADDFGLENEQINSMAADDQNRIWIGTLKGAASFDGVSWTAYTSGNSGLVDNAVFTIAIQAKSPHDTVWFGSLSGITSFDEASSGWNSYTRQDIDLGWGGVSDLMFDASGRLWASTEGGGISQWDGHQWTSLRVSNSALPYSIVQEVTEFEPGVFWIAASIPNASGGVLAKYDGSSWKIYRPNFSGYSGAETVTMAMDQSGRYWFGTRTDGINLFEPKR